MEGELWPFNSAAQDTLSWSPVNARPQVAPKHLRRQETNGYAAQAVVNSRAEQLRLHA